MNVSGFSLSEALLTLVALLSAALTLPGPQAALRRLYLRLGRRGIIILVLMVPSWPGTGCGRRFMF